MGPRPGWNPDGTPTSEWSYPTSPPVRSGSSPLLLSGRIWPVSGKRCGLSPCSLACSVISNIIQNEPGSGRIRGIIVENGTVGESVVDAPDRLPVAAVRAGL
jgi:hypothetical protein